MSVRPSLQEILLTPKFTVCNHKPAKSRALFDSVHDVFDLPSLIKLAARHGFGGGASPIVETRLLQLFGRFTMRFEHSREQERSPENVIAKQNDTRCVIS
jgi:hypothetical protein